MIGWEPPARPLGKITRYLVRMTWDGGSASETKDLEGESHEREVTFTKLKAGTLYKFKVCHVAFCFVTFFIKEVNFTQNYILW